MRLYDQRGLAAADVMGLESEDIEGSEQLTLHHPIRHDFHRTVSGDDIQRVEPLLEPAWIDGERVIVRESIEQPRARREADMSRLDPGVRRLMNPHVYHVSLTQALWELKQETVESTGDGWQD